MLAPAQGLYHGNSKWTACDPDAEALAEDTRRQAVNNVAGETHIQHIDVLLTNAGSLQTCIALAMLSERTTKKPTILCAAAAWAPSADQELVASSGSSNTFTTLRQVHQDAGMPLLSISPS